MQEQVIHDYLAVFFFQKRQEKELVGKGKKELYIVQMLVEKNGFGIFG
jgi:hypothetical protein